ncbi:Tfx family DNA-binding protein [Halorubrum sp. BV1]|uniref:Tfx family DNA-binding protein n=1 Tax=Halorubrum sp. BV1 TaxID=1498500 RepID=UPI0006795E9C|nr:Tfx family DNA-binding protein [Halorubrum sp. BV1]
MVATDSTTLTDRQVEVLELRERGHTQQEVADRLGTTDSNISAIERAAEQNVEKARRTLELVRTIRSPVQFSVSPGTSFDDLVADVYAHGDEAGIKIAYCRPELYTHLYGALEGCTNQNELDATIDVGLTTEGEVRVFTGEI